MKIKLPLSQYKKGEGEFSYVVNKDGSDIHFNDMLDMISNEVGFCGCGMPNDAYKYLLDTLKLIEARSEIEFREKGKWEEHKEKENELHGSDGAAYFIWYWLDSKGYTEHGGSVPGWLTEDGIILIKAIEEALSN